MLLETVLTSLLVYPSICNSSLHLGYKGFPGATSSPRTVLPGQNSATQAGYSSNHQNLRTKTEVFVVSLFTRDLAVLSPTVDSSSPGRASEESVPAAPCHSGGARAGQCPWLLQTELLS